MALIVIVGTEAVIMVGVVLTAAQAGDVTLAALRVAGSYGVLGAMGMHVKMCGSNR